MLKQFNSNLCPLGAYESPRCKCVEMRMRRGILVTSITPDGRGFLDYKGVEPGAIRGMQDIDDYGDL